LNVFYSITFGTSGSLANFIIKDLKILKKEKSIHKLK